MTAREPGRRPHPPFDQDLAQAFARLQISFTPFNDDSLPQLRLATMLGPPAISVELDRYGVAMTDHIIDGPRGDIVVSVLTPTGGARSAPAIYFIHGGGMLIGDRFFTMNYYDLVTLVAEYGLVVATVEYRMAPEHPGRAAVDDCYAGLLWLGENSAQLGIDVHRIILAGTSGGGGLAASTALLVRDLGGPSLLAQVLWCPQLDDRNNFVSAEQFSTDVSPMISWTLEDHSYAWDLILGQGHENEHVSPYLAANRADDLAGLPPAFIDVGVNDVFRDMVVAYASKLWASGVAAEIHVWPGAFHGFEALFPDVPIASAARAVQANAIQRILEGSARR